MREQKLRFEAVRLSNEAVRLSNEAVRCSSIRAVRAVVGVPCPPTRPVHTPAHPAHVDGTVRLAVLAGRFKPSWLRFSLSGPNISNC